MTNLLTNDSLPLASTDSFVSAIPGLCSPSLAHMDYTETGRESMTGVDRIKKSNLVEQ